MTGRGAAAAVGLAVLLLGSATADAGEPVRLAIVIGVNQPEDSGRPTLRYADDDAVATHELLGEAGVQSILLTRLDRDTRRLHSIAPDGQPTWAALERALASVDRTAAAARAAGQETELLLFYSGHGDVANGEGYIVLEDGRLTRSHLHERILTRSRADRIHVVIDACKSYYLAFEKRAGGKRHRFGKSFARHEQPADLAHVGFVLSTSDDRDSHEWERLQAGVFSHEVRSALRGAADADQDGRVSYAELGAFLRAANEAIPNARFRPAFTVRPPGGAGNLSAELLGWSETELVLQVDRDVGHIYVEASDGRRIVDAHPAPGQTLSLHLPPARPQFVKTADDESEYVIADAARAVLSALAQGTPTTVRRGAAHLAFERLFAVPFDATSVRSYVEDRRADVAVTSIEAPRAGPPPDDPPSTRERIETITLWTGGGATVVGLALTGLMWTHGRVNSDASQVERAEINTDIRQLKAGATVAYSVAAASAAVWLTARLWPRAPALTVVPAGDSAGVAWSTQW